MEYENYFIHLSPNCRIDEALSCISQTNRRLDEIDACLAICHCLYGYQLDSMVEKINTSGSNLNKKKRFTLNSIELAEINILCIYDCSDNTNLFETCFQTCENSLEQLMLNGQVEKIENYKFTINENKSEYKYATFIIYFVLIAFVVIAIIIVCKQINQGLKERRDTKRFRFQQQQEKWSFKKHFLKMKTSKVNRSSQMILFENDQLKSPLLEPILRNKKCDSVDLK